MDIRDAETGESVRSFHGHDLDVNDVAFSRDGAMLATAGDDGAARIWDPATGEELWSFESPDGRSVWGPSFSPDDSRLAAVWPDSGEGDRPGHRANGPRDHPVLARSPVVQPGRRTARDVGEESRRRWSWMPPPVTSVHPPGSPFALHDVAWSPDGRWIATTSYDATARIWEADTGPPIHTARPRVPIRCRLEPRFQALDHRERRGTAKLWRITDQGRGSCSPSPRRTREPASGGWRSRLTATGSWQET